MKTGSGRDKKNPTDATRRSTRIASLTRKSPTLELQTICMELVEEMNERYLGNLWLNDLFIDKDSLLDVVDYLSILQKASLNTWLLMIWTSGDEY